MAHPKRNLRDPLESAFEARGVTFQQLSPAEAVRLQKRWRKVFAHRVQEATGEAVHLGFAWHAFSYDLAYALDHDSAVAAYAKERVPSFFFALPNLGHGNIPMRGEAAS